MSLDRSGVQRQDDGIFAELGQSLKDRAPSVFLGPAIETIVDRRVGAVLVRTIAPACPRLQHMDDAADDASIVVPLRTWQAVRKMPLDPRPLPVIQPKQTRTHSLAPYSQPGAMNHVAAIRYRP
jgi:hypothetical protein